MTFSIDSNRCNACGLCVADCPVRVLQQSAPKAVPTAPDHESQCIGCGHCIAICSQRAIRLGDVDPESLKPATRLTRDTFAAIDAAVHCRRSIRSFAREPVSQETLAALIQSARYAPTGGNAQQVRWTVLRSAPAVARVAELTAAWLKARLASAPAQEPFLSRMIDAYAAGRDPICRGAATLVVCHADTSAISGGTDCVIALSYFDLLASASGLGTCWAGLVRMAAQGQALRDELGIPANSAVHGAMMVGHPKVGYHFVPTRKAAEISWKE